MKKRSIFIISMLLFFSGITFAQSGWIYCYIDFPTSGDDHWIEEESAQVTVLVDFVYLGHVNYYNSGYIDFTLTAYDDDSIGYDVLGTVNGDIYVPWDDTQYTWYQTITVDYSLGKDWPSTADNSQVECYAYVETTAPSNFTLTDRDPTTGTYPVSYSVYEQKLSPLESEYVELDERLVAIKNSKIKLVVKSFLNALKNKSIEDILLVSDFPFYIDSEKYNTSEELKKYFLKLFNKKDFEWLNDNKIITEYTSDELKHKYNNSSPHNYFSKVKKYDRHIELIVDGNTTVFLFRKIAGMWKVIGICD